jgi:hypothetical protein
VKPRKRPCITSTRNRPRRLTTATTTISRLNDEEYGGFTELVCLNWAGHYNPVSYTVRKGDSNACPECGRGN